MAAFAEHAEAKQQAATVIAAAAEAPAATLPDLPPHLVKCLAGQKSGPGKQNSKTKAKGKNNGKGDGQVVQDKAHKATPSADEMVLARLQAAETSQKCGQALIAWYRGVSQAHKAKTKT
jgi:hypothetical protein